MNIVVLKGSPHKNGSSNTLAQAFIDGATEAGHTLTVLDVARMKVHPCLGCPSCHMDNPCVWQDDFPHIRKALLEADMAVFVTPLYYFGMSAQLKLVIDRFYSFSTKLAAKKLKTALIAAAWDSNPKMLSYLSGHYQGICDHMHFEDMGQILGAGCGTPAMTHDSPHLAAAYALGHSL